MPKLRGATFRTAVIERYRRRETSVEETIVEMYQAGVSTRRIEDGARRVRRDVCLHGIPTGALAPDQDEQRNRAHRPRDQEEDEAVGTYPDGNSAVMLVSARLNYIAKHEWGKRRYLDMSKLEETDELKGKAEGWKRTGPRTAI